MDIVDTAASAASAGSFTTLMAAVETAGLAGTLLMPENRDQLVAILTYHVVPAKVMSADLDGQTVTARSVNGERLTVDGRRGVQVNDAKVVQADIEASNGAIHVVDSVILPQG